MVFELYGLQGGLLRLPLPIGGEHGFPVPVLSWAGVIAYAWITGAILGWQRSDRLSGALRLGLVLHAVVLVSSLPWQMGSGYAGWPLVSWYTRFWQAVWAVVLAAGLVVIWESGRRWKITPHPSPYLFYFPWLVGWIVLLQSARALPLVVGVAGIVMGLVGIVAANSPLWPRLKARGIALASRERVFLGLAFCVALALRLFYSFRILSDPNFLATGSDGPFYDSLAWELVHGGTTASSPLVVPGYIRFLALIYWAVGRNYPIVLAVQSLLGALACVILYDVVKRLFDGVTAHVATVFAVLNFPMIFAAAAIGHQAVDVFLTLMVVWCLIRYLDAPDRWGRWMWAVGMLLGWAAATREGNIFFWAFLVLWWVVGVRARLGWRRACGHLAACSLGFLIVLWPFVGGKGVGLRVRFGELWFISYPGDLRKWFNPWDDPQGALAVVWNQPLELISSLSHAIWWNFSTQFFNQDFGNFDPVFLVRDTSYYFGMWAYAYLFAFIGLGLVVRQAVREPVERLGWWLLITVIVSRTLAHLFWVSAYRHRIPIEPYLIALGAYGLTRVFSVAYRLRPGSSPGSNLAPPTSSAALGD